MCGIAGMVVPPGAVPDRQVLEAMGAAMAHRGPDEGAVVDLGRCGLSFRRLSIIDVAGGHQPIVNEDETCWLILNGEIYNHEALREDLEARGHHFRTRSDAEAALHAYEEYGVDCLERLRGMFAFALWDVRHQRLFAARDRLGKKPLFYHASRDTFAFASELRALMSWPGAPREISLEAIHHYLTYQYVPAPLTAFERVCKLPAGHFLLWEGGNLHIERYWHLRYEPKWRGTEEGAAAELLDRLRESVRLRLMSEVPLGAFLSGGVDSSAVVALMSEFGRVKTFSIGFDRADFDETTHARRVAAHFGTEHHEFVVKADAVDVLPRLVEHYGEPYADSSALPTYYLSRLTADHVTVALSGDGGDELFAGYQRYPAAAPPGHATLATPWLLRRLWRGRRAWVREGWRENYCRMMSYFSPEQKDEIYSAEMRARFGINDSYALLDRLFAATDATDSLDQLLAVDTHSYLPDDLLVKVDIASMAHSLEVRCPFLDHTLAEFAARLPADLKLHRGVGKYVLKKAMAAHLPRENVHRRKMGFGVPLAEWFRGDLKPLFRETVLSTRAAQRPFFDPAAVRNLAERHFSGREDHGPRLWALLTLELWCRRFVDAPLAQAVPTPLEVRETHA